MAESLNIGDRVRISGGYDMEPRWLNGRQHLSGTVTAFIPGQNETPAAVIELDENLSREGSTGRYLVLELRYAGAAWTAEQTVHVELCDFIPEARSWHDRKRGQWVESHATYRKLARQRSG